MICNPNTYQFNTKDIFLYNVVVPVLPFVLTSRVGVDKAEGKANVPGFDSSLTHHIVQVWTSVSLAVYAAAILISARELCVTLVL